VTTAVGPGPAEDFRRTEVKLLLNSKQVPFLVAWLGHVCSPDKEFPVGQVTSCYFDNRDWDSYFASRDGDLEKQKVRLRWYGTPPPSGSMTAYLEVKEKDGFETWKRRQAVAVDASHLQSHNFEATLPRKQMRQALAELGVFTSSELRPALVISYLRRRYWEPISGTRVSLDTNVSAFLAGPTGDRLQERQLESTVLELKGAGYGLPARMKSVTRFAPLWSSHSKYALAVEAFVGAGLLRV